MLRILLTLSVLTLPAFAAEQMIVSIADGWNATTGRLQLFERTGKTWPPTSPAWRVLYGANGLAWGRGEHPETPPSQNVPVKRERDKRAPAGLFEIGKIFTYDSALPDGASFPFHTITDRDAWIDDPLHPDYNRHVRIGPGAAPPWFEKQRMRLNDPPHRWLIEIRHNSDPIVPGAGSAIFFHIQRGPERRSAGCTVMPETDLRRIIGWLDASKSPRYVLLPRDVYLDVWKKWGLPSPAEAASVIGN